MHAVLSHDGRDQAGGGDVEDGVADAHARGDDALDRLYELIDGDRPRVVFNDAQASRGLSGWDRARWARHLAVKVLAAGDIDPPRPQDARGVEAPLPAEPLEPALVAAQVPAETTAVAEAPAASSAAEVEDRPPASGPGHETTFPEPDFLPPPQSIQKYHPQKLFSEHLKAPAVD